jgi:hypothetical protein
MERPSRPEDLSNIQNLLKDKLNLAMIIEAAEA